MAEFRFLSKAENRRIDGLLEAESEAVKAAREAIGTASWSSRMEQIEIAEQRTRIFLVRLGVVPAGALFG